MAQSIKAERAVMTRDEFQVLSRTHLPALRQSDDKTLAQTRRAIRDLREKERTFVSQLRRSIRGKVDTRGGSYPGEVERPALRKQFFSAALKRLNSEVERRRSATAKEDLKASARKALAMRAAAPKPDRPSPGRSADGGMTPIGNEKPETRIPPAQVGSVSQATKNAQAARDNRG